MMAGILKATPTITPATIDMATGSPESQATNPATPAFIHSYNSYNNRGASNNAGYTWQHAQLRQRQ